MRWLLGCSRSAAARAVGGIAAALALALGMLLAPSALRAQAEQHTPRVDATAGERRFTLGDALRLMRASHPALQVQAREIEARRADVTANKLWTNPSVSVQYAKGVTHTSYDQLGYLYYGVSQFVELANVPGMRKRQSALLADAARADRVATDVQLSLALESALIDLVAARRNKAILDLTLSLLESAGRIVNERVAAGAAPRYDATRIAVTLALAHADQAEGAAAVARAQAEFAAAVGPRAGELQGEPDYDLFEGPPLPDAARLMEYLERNRPDLVAARSRAASALVGVKTARRSVFSGVSVTLAGGFGAAPQQNDVGAGIVFPLTLVDRGQGTIPAARARAEEAAAVVDAVRVPALARIAGMQREVTTRREALAEYRTRGVTSNDEMLGEAQAGYLAGRFSVLELADAYRAFRDGRLREIELGAAARQAEIDLGHEIGRPLRDL
jgi:cobalt-zinc-cadmium efflux system outer membrane protein